MISKIDIFENIQNLIKQEKGETINYDDLLEEANLDSFGLVVFVTELCILYPLDYKNTNLYEKCLELEKLTIREIVNLCILAIKSKPKSNEIIDI